MKSEIQSLKEELAATKKIMWKNGHLLDKAEEILKELVDGIDIWNESMEKVIGRQVNYKWQALEEAREFLKNNK